VRPEPRLIRWLLAVFFCAAVSALWRPLLPLALVVDIAVVAAASIDALRARRLGVVRVRRVVSGALALGNWAIVRLEIDSPSEHRMDAEVHDHHPINGEARGLPRNVVVLPGRTTVLNYRYRPDRRGPWSFEPVELMLLSPWRLWRIRRRAGESTQVKVFPDFKSVQRYALLARDNSIGLLGVRKRRRRGEGLELRQLREYREGDSLRQIDWKATSRRDRAISREYEDERNQQVVFLLDCGRRMRAVDDGEVHFDHALNSVLLLTYVALRQGDAVGLMTLGGCARWLPPQKGPAAMTAMLEQVYDLETQPSAPDFSKTATELMAYQRRRALVVVVSNLRDEDGDEVAAAVRLLRRRHLVLLASLRETSLDRALEQPVSNFAQALRTGAAHHFLASRRRAHNRLRDRGVFAIDVTPASLPIAIVNGYLDVKRSGAL